jgi:hypothetical protein
MRQSFNSRISVFQTDDAGALPAWRTLFAAVGYSGNPRTRNAMSPERSRAVAPFLLSGITVVHRSLKPGGLGAIPSSAATSKCGP